MASITSQIETDEFIYVTQRGMAKDRTPLPQGRSPPGELEFRCVDLWREAFRVMDQGCSYTQFYNDPEHMRCKGCGLLFSKLYLRSAFVLTIEAVPPDYKPSKSH
ncbi:hypothetical protein FRC04_011818 [Tulasnella sp. 424]|nr:hypothetical protein FRC04_011818 [Tulasnella sp. 424]KAG8978166.1 hypothetical protein FRC05_011282 [Tulasnella sp. 425]